MDRRDFIKTAGLGAAGAALAACAPKAGSSASQPSVLPGQMPQNYPGIGVLGYGCMRWPMIKDEAGRDIIDQQKVNELVDYAIAHGINYFDSAPVYLQGQSEAATGKALSRYPRDSYYIATKLSNQRGFSPSFDEGVEMYHRSMEYFQTDYLDYYLMHNLADRDAFERRFVQNGLVDFMLKERDAGRIRHLGFSFHGYKDGFDDMLALHDKYHWDFIQIQMNYLDWEHPSGMNTRADYLYEQLDKREIPIVIMEPLRGGSLAEVPQQLAAQMKEREPEKSIASWAFRFVGSYPRVMCALSGMTYMEHLQDNLDTFLDFKPLSDEEKAFLWSVADQMVNYPLVPCTGCQYCMPCPYGIDIPGVFKFYNDRVTAGSYVVSKEQKGYARARRKYLLEYNEAIASVRQADHCISCRKCERDCPQNIRIPDQLRRIDRYIEDLKQELL